MLFDLDIMAAFIIGLAGSGHCLGMCGGIVSALSLGSSEANSSFSFQRLLNQLMYNIGRITAYLVIAVIFSSLLLVSIETYSALLIPLRTFSGVILVLMGLYLVGRSTLILKLENLGRSFWHKIQPFAKRILPIRRLHHAPLAGFLWGWLPCGLVYSSVIWVSSTGHPIHAAWLMLFFGLGTLPSMLLTGVFSQQFGYFWRHFNLPLIMGILLIIYGIWTIPLSQSFIMMLHSQHS